MRRANNYETEGAPNIAKNGKKRTNKSLPGLRPVGAPA